MINFKFALWIILNMFFVAQGQSVKDFYTSGEANFESGNYINAIHEFTKALELIESPKIKDTLSDPLESLVISVIKENALLFRGICKANVKDYRGCILDQTRVINEFPYNNLNSASLR